MKKIIYLFIATSITVACNQAPKEQSPNSLEAERFMLTTKIDSLNTKLQEVEAALAKLDTAKVLPLVTVLHVEHSSFKHYIEVQGVVMADKNIELRPELGGVVEQILVQEGQRVTAGQVLLQLNDDLIEKSIAELNTQLSLARTTFERQERLWSQKIGSEMQYLQAKTQLKSLESSMASLKTQADKMKIIAPFSGIVDEIFPKKGELTSMQTSLIRLIDLNQVYVETEVTETYLPVVKKGTEVLLEFPSIQKDITAVISQVGNYINPDNRSFRTRVNVSNPDGAIKPNLLADVKILDFEAQGIAIPVNLIQQDQYGNDYVFTVKTVDNETIVTKQQVSTGLEYQQRVFIEDGLTENDILINAGARLIKAGDQVKIDREE
jgi:RND family efflux transporter MFP subunit